MTGEPNNEASGDYLEINLDPRSSPGDASSAIPRTIGDFHIIREIGRGGMGTVYEAEQISLKRRVALKVLPSHLSFSDEAVQKFRREAEAGGRQSHSGIVAVYAVGEEGGIHYIAQEIVAGGFTLADMLDEFREQSEQPPGYFRDTAQLIARIADALEHAHDSGVIHRDIKPSNILLTDDGQPKVTDFGLAKVEDALALSRSGDFAGTPYYMSPEQAMSRRMGIDHRTDIFSLGVTLYEVLTLERPFLGETSHEVLKRILLFDPASPHKENPRVPRDLSTVCLKAMEKAPEKRYQSMKEFSDDLRRFLSGDVILAKPAGLHVRIWKRAKRNPVVSAAAGVAVLAIMTFSVVVPWVIAAQREAANIVIEKEKNEAIAARREAETLRQAAETLAETYAKQAAELLRLSDLKNLKDLEEKADELWPVSLEWEYGLEIKNWLFRAEELLSHLEDHRRTLSELEESLLKTNVSDLDGELKLEDILPDGTRVKDYEITFLSHDPESKGEEDFFGLDEKSWWIETLDRLVKKLEAFVTDETSAYHSIKKRRDFIQALSKAATDHEESWKSAVASISDRAECPRYDGLLIEPQVGLVPLGRDPESGLWEFAHLQTGAVPRRGPDRKLILSEETGLIFVLIPPGTFNMGAVRPAGDRPLDAPNVDPHAESDEAPVHAVTLAPFFLSKYEMTQGQWERVTGNNPSYYVRENYNPRSNRKGEGHSVLHPVGQVSWNDCDQVFGRLSLLLPTEAQWEYAARAGTATVWWTGNGVASLQGAANLCDLHAKKNGAPDGWTCEESLDDGHLVHAPVGSFRANPFGLHDTIGNVWEWCRDGFGPYTLPIEEGDGERRVSDARYRVLRGGSFHLTSPVARSAFRLRNTPDPRGHDLGVRPARVIE